MNAKIGALAITALMLTMAVPVASAGPFEEARDRWLTARADFLDLYSEWMSARADLLRAIAGGESAATRVSLAKDAGFKASKVLIKGLETLKARVEATRGLDNENKELLSTELSGYISELQAKQAGIQAAENGQQVRSAIKELWDYWRSIRVRAKQITAQVIVAWADGVVQKLEAFAGRIEAKKEELKDNGVDTSALESWLADFNSRLASAKEKVANAEDRVDEITDNTTFLDIFRAVRQYVKEGISYLKEALRSLKEIFRDIKNRGHEVTITGSGTLIAQGDGRAEITGTGTVEVKAPIQGEMQVSSNAEVTTTGEGTKTTLDNGYVKYQGYGSASVTGTGITVYISGNGISIEASGTGTVKLVGTGSYSTYGENYYVDGTWTATETTATLATGEVSVGVA